MRLGEKYGYFHIFDICGQFGPLNVAEGLKMAQNSTFVAKLKISKIFKFYILFKELE